MDSSEPKQEKVVPVSGNLCILGHEIPVNEETLENAGRDGSTTLDDLFGCNVAYSTALLSCVPAFYTSQIEFPTVIEHVLGTLYKHPTQWNELKRALATDDGYVTIHICPLSGVPMIFGSDKIFKININETLQLNLPATSISRLSKVTHMNLEPEAAQEGLEYIREIGLVGSLIEDMGTYITSFLAFVAGTSEEDFVELMQELLYSGEVHVDLDLDAGTYFVDTSMSDDLDDTETLDDLLYDESLDDDNILSMGSDAPMEEDFDEESVEQMVKEMMRSDPGVNEQLTLTVNTDDLKNPSSVFLKGNKTIH